MKIISRVAAVHDHRTSSKIARLFPVVIDRRYTGMLLLALTLLLTACSKLTSANLEKIQSGMSPDEVKSILGAPTDIQTQGALGLSSTTYTYHTSSADVKITFINDKEMAKEGTFK